MNTNRKYRIGVLGIGGVGGYIGAKLAHKYTGKTDVEIILVARGEHKEKIAADGITLIDPEGDVKARPDLVTDDPTAIPVLDLIISTSKSYSLEELFGRYKNSIDASTIILPIQNGVDAGDKIKELVPQATVLDGCIYLNARKTAPGIITQTGQVHTIHFGSDTVEQSKLQAIEKLLKDAGIDARLANPVSPAIWEKFVFISAVATMTCYTDRTIGQLRESETDNALLAELVREVTAVADAKGIVLPTDIFERAMNKVAQMPYNATSSMHSDMKAGKPTEMNSLTAYVVKEGKQHHIATPAYERLLNALMQPIA